LKIQAFLLTRYGVIVTAISEGNPYNQKAQYLIKSQKSQIHKIINIKELKNMQETVNVLNIRKQLD
jgi:hypothetical protein